MSLIQSKPIQNSLLLVQNIKQLNIINKKCGSSSPHKLVTKMRTNQLPTDSVAPIYLPSNLFYR